MSSLGSGNLRKNVLSRRKKEIVVKEKNISGDEFMSASIGDEIWLDQSLRRDSGKIYGYDRNGLTPIHLAALHGRIKCLELLVEKYGNDVNFNSTTGWQALHLCLNKDIGHRAKECMVFLLENGADTNAINSDNTTPIHRAAGEGLLDCLKILIRDENTKIDVVDKRGHTPYELARLWGHKKCARVLKNEMWEREKTETAKELEQLEIVKQYYGDLQKDAVHQLRNEQEFYGNVAFGNWLSDKSLPEVLKNSSFTQKERYPSDNTVEGLLKRLKASGGLDDCALRLQKVTARQQKLARRSIAPHKSYSSETKSKPGKAAKDDVKKTGQVKKVKVEHIATDSFGRTPTMFTPYSEATQPTVYHSVMTPWNFSTNLNSDPKTDIKHKTLVSLSIFPDEPESCLPGRANLPVKLDNSAGIRVLMPGGTMQNTNIKMPNLPHHVIRTALSGETEDRIRIPQEFKAVHVYDLQKKKEGTKPPEEAAMHLSYFGDPRIIPQSMIVKPSAAPKGKSDAYDNLPPLSEKGITRIIDTLKGMNSPRTFLV